MNFVVGILTFILVINCLLLILLVLVQLPKKDAGAGMAFGAGTADALFGAGSGNALTKITKYAAIAFLGLAIVLGFMQGKSSANNSATDFTKMVEQKQMQVPVAAPTQQPKPQTPPSSGLLSTPMATPATNASVPATTTPAK